MQNKLEEYRIKYEDNYLSFARENRLKHFEPDFHKDLVKFISAHFKEREFKRFSAKIYLFLNQVTEIPVCKHCEKKETKFKQYSHGYFDYCSTKCSSNSIDKKEKIEETCLEKYGHRNIAQGTIKKKIAKIYKEKYEEGHPSRDSKTKKKKDLTRKRKVKENPNYFQEINEKAKKTWQKNYGTDNPMQAKKIIKKSLKKREELGLIKKWTKKEIESYKEYKHAVYYYSNTNYIEHFYEINPKKLKRGTHDYHLDHIFPVIEGWLNDVPPKTISHYKNLQMLSSKKNRSKSSKTDMTVEQFYELINENKLVETSSIPLEKKK